MASWRCMFIAGQLDFFLCPSAFVERRIFISVFFCSVIPCFLHRIPVSTSPFSSPSPLRVCAFDECRGMMTFHALFPLVPPCSSNASNLFILPRLLNEEGRRGREPWHWNEDLEHWPCHGTEEQVENSPKPPRLWNAEGQRGDVETVILCWKYRSHHKAMAKIVELKNSWKFAFSHEGKSGDGELGIQCNISTELGAWQFWTPICFPAKNMGLILEEEAQKALIWTSLRSESHWCHLFHTEEKNWDSTIWFRFLQFKTPA